MKRHIYILFAGLMMAATACIYTESGVYTAVPVPGDPPVFSVTTNLDTIIDPILTDSLEVVYDVEIENGEFYQAEAYILNELVFNSDTIHGSFWLYPRHVLEPGLETLDIYFFYSTNSNSLADIVGLEFNVLQLDFPIIFEQGGLP